MTINTRYRVRFEFLFFILFAPLANPLQGQPPEAATINHRGQEIFVSGMNLAWIDFANDLRNLDTGRFTTAMDELSEAGGNTFRWWIHVNGRHSPEFTDNMVSGLHPDDLHMLEHALDIAYERGVLLILCLWSFDMLQPNAQQSNWPRNRLLLENPEYTRAYIDNALVPMVRALKDHPGILAWEIFNEPEGMCDDIPWAGWTPERTQIKHVQRFINLTAGAIHREAPDALVTNGSWNFSVMTDIGGMTNYYSDQQLIAAGGDSLGTLDFYQIHFYPEHFDETTSPFHNPAGHWELDKPILIGEFSAKGLSGRPAQDLTTEEAYLYAYLNGYIGALSWTYSGHDGHGDLSDCASALKMIRDMNPAIIDIVPDETFHFPPAVIEDIPGFITSLSEEETEPLTVTNLATIFGSPHEGVKLSYAVTGNTNEEICHAFIESDSLLMLTVIPGQTGMGKVTVSATDNMGKSATTGFYVSVVDPGSEDRLLYRLASASSLDSPDRVAQNAVDGLSNTRWSSSYNDNQWITVELEKKQTIQRVMLDWEVAFGKEYIIQVSDDGQEWVDVFTETDGRGGLEKILFDPVETRFIRMMGISRGTQWGFSLWQFQAFSTPGENTPPYFIESIDDITIGAETDLLLSLANIAGDDDPGDRVFFSVVEKGTGTLPGWLTFNESTKVLSGTPAYSDIGDYTIEVTITDIAGASATQSFMIHVLDPTSVHEHGAKNTGFVLFPNPASHKITCVLSLNSPSEYTIRVIDIGGKTILHKTGIYNNMLPCNNVAIDIQHLRPGMYILTVDTPQFSASQKFEKR